MSSESRTRGTVSRRALLAGGLALGGAAALDLGMGRGAAPALAASAAVPKRGGTLIAAQEVDPLTLDPHTDSNFSALQGFEHIYESLTGYDEKMNVVPALAQKWEITNDGKTYTFHLRPNVKFHNGQPMTADDVKYSIERVLDPKTAAPLRSWFDAIQEIKVVDPADGAAESRRAVPGPPERVRGAARVRHHAEGLRGAGEPQDQRDRDRPVQAGRVRPPRPHHATRGTRTTGTSRCRTSTG